MKQTNSTTQPPVHEVDHNSRHRIIIFRGSIPLKSPWFQPYEIAHFHGLFASVREEGGIPQGIFRINPVKHEAL